MALDTTVSGASSNSYASVSEADAYFTLRLNTSEWTGATTGVKEAALAQACRTIDLEDFAGYKTITSQALKWPRVGILDSDGNSVDSTTIATFVKNAQFELALRLLKYDADTDLQREQFERVRLGELEAVFRPGTPIRMPGEIGAFFGPAWYGGGSRILKG